MEKGFVSYLTSSLSPLFYHSNLLPTLMEGCDIKGHLPRRNVWPAHLSLSSGVTGPFYLPCTFSVFLRCKFGLIYFLKLVNNVLLCTQINKAAWLLDGRTRPRTQEAAPCLSPIMNAAGSTTTTGISLVMDLYHPSKMLHWLMFI